MEWTKTWYTAQEIANLKLPGIPTTRQGVLDRAKRNKWPTRPDSIKENGGREYLLLLVILEAEFEGVTTELSKDLQVRIEQLESQHKEAGNVLKYLRRLCKSKGIFLAQA